MEYTVQTTDLSKKYGDHYVVQDVSIHVPRGKVYGLLGRNGAGKTTTMKMLLGLTQKTSGSIVLFNKEVMGYQEEVYSRIGSMIESPGFYPNLTASENLAVFSRLRGRVDERKIRHALDVVGLPYGDKKPFSKFSLGMKQRMGIANALMNDAELLILDEPTNGLDPIGIAEMRTLIKALCHEQKKTVLISSHQLAEMEQLVDWVGIIHNGLLLEECSYQTLKKKEHPHIRLKVECPEQVCRYLENELHLVQCQMTDASVIDVYDLRFSTLELNFKLFSAGFGVAEIFMCQDSLEDYFKELTGGVGIA